MFGRISIFRRVSGGLVATLLLLLGGTSASAYGLSYTFTGSKVSANTPGTAFKLTPTVRLGLIDFLASEGENFSRVPASAITKLNGGGVNKAGIKLVWDENPLWLSNGTQLGKPSSIFYGKMLARSTINVKLVTVELVRPVV